MIWIKSGGNMNYVVEQTLVKPITTWNSIVSSLLGFSMFLAVFFFFFL
jgi:hypothetical protein